MTVPAVSAQYGNYYWFLEEIGDAMNGRRDRSTWSIDQESRAKNVLERALFAFYFPPPTVRNQDGQPVGKPHEWSFLFPTQTMTVAAGENTKELPEDFAGSCTQFVFTTRENTWKIAVVSSAELRAVMNRGTLASLDSAVRGSESRTDSQVASGIPAYAAIEPKQMAGIGRQRYEVLFYPTPHVDMNLTYAYQISPAPLSESNPWPIGNTIHTETILAGCRAMVHELYNVGNPAWKNSYMERLVASIAADKSLQTTTATLYPVQSSNDDLSVDYNYLVRIVGNALGYGWSVDSFTYEQKRIVDDLIDAGLRTYYYPEPVDFVPMGHVWSFLTPLFEFETADGQREYDLPGDFESPQGTITFAASRNSMYPEIPFASENQLRSLHNAGTSSGVPRLAATIAVSERGTASQKQKLILHPTPNSAYLLAFRYSATQRRINASNPYPLGGKRHGQAFIEACLAQVELYQGKAAGPHYTAFRRILATNIASDLRRGARVLGYNGDPGVGSRGIDRRINFDAVMTYGGRRYNA